MAPPNACDFCRKRKFRCSREEPQCSKCVQFNKDCTYSPRAQRGPKTQVQQLERRIKALERILIQFVQTKENLDTFLESLSVVGSNINDRLNENNADLSPDPEQGQTSTAYDTNINLEDEGSLALEDFGNLLWQENDFGSGYEDNTTFDRNPTSFSDSPVDVIDGMGALTIEKKNMLNERNTFYGISSSNGFLRFLRNKLCSGYQQEQRYSSTMKSLFNKDNINLLKSEHAETLLDDSNLRNDLLNSYFEIYHKSYPIILKLDFISRYDARKKSLKSYEPESINEISFDILLNTILAIGALCKLGESSIIDLLYYRRVRNSIKKINLMECGSYQLLEALIILGNYVQKRNKPNTCWNYHGLAVRMAVSFGLHKEINALDNLDTQDSKVCEILERRRRLWWGLFFFDVGSSITFGRPILSPSLESIDIRFPLNLEDEELEKLDKGKPIEILHKNYPTIYASSIQEAKLSKISSKIYNYIIRTEGGNEHYISSMLWAINLNKLILNYVKGLPAYYLEDDSYANQYLKDVCPSNWFKINLDGSVSIPKWFELSRRRLIWRYKNIQILMFRKFICQSSLFFDKPDSHSSFYSAPVSNNLLNICISICHKAASESITSISNFINTCELDTLSSWYSTYFTFQAALISVLLLYIYPNINYEEMDIELCLREVELSKRNLRVLKEFNNSAENLEETLQSLVNPIIDHLQKETTSKSKTAFLNNDVSNYPLASNLFSGVYFDFSVVNEFNSNIVPPSSIENEHNSQAHSHIKVSDMITDSTLNEEHENAVLSSFLRDELLTDNTNIPNYFEP